MIHSSLTKDQILEDMQTIYQLALDDGKWHVALRAKELQGKILGLFEKQHLPKVTSIADMTKDQLCEFITRLEEHDPELKNSGAKMDDLNMRERDLDMRELKIHELESELARSKVQTPGWQTPEQQMYRQQPSEPEPPELKPPD